MTDIKKEIRNSRTKEVEDLLRRNIENLNHEGYEVEFGKIGKHTTYALLHKNDHDDEIVGYTFIRDLKFYKENIGNLKALQQAIARKNIAEGKTTE